jgi:putative CRISPR-associated protein (TIGR02619 family)
MSTRLLLVSTCGTSLLSNGASPDHRQWLNEHANDVDVDATKLAAIVDPIRDTLRSSDAAELRAMSAELNSVHAVIDRYHPEQLFHVLVHTDTVLGKQCATLVQESLGGSTILVTAGGLRTDNLVSFREALADLTKQLDEFVQSYRDNGWFVVFNLTAGFKSLNGYLQALAMITADRCVYLFEGCDCGSCVLSKIVNSFVGRQACR